MKTKKAIRKHNHNTLLQDYPLLLVIMFALIALSLVVMIFYVATIISFQRSLLSGSSYGASGMHVIESTNYHSFQLPQKFPVELIRARVGGFISSQELTAQSIGSLKYVSFYSTDSVEALTSFYREFLWRKVFKFTEQSDADRTSTLSASRSDMSYDFGIKPTEQGSIVAIYYRLAE